MKAPLISVLISAYNHEKFITECIESIWEQNYKNIEILIIDDNSSDRTYNILKDLENKSPFPMYIYKNNENKGIAHNLNRLIYLAKGDIISFMSSDDKFYNSNIFQEISYIFGNNYKIQVIYTEGLIWDGNKISKTAQGKLEKKLLKRKEFSKLYQYMVTNVPLLLIQGSFIRKPFLEAIGGFDNDLRADDWVLNIKILKETLEKKDLYDILFLDTIGFLYRQHENNSIKRRDYLLNLILEVINKYTPETEKKCFIGNLYWRYGLFLIKNKKFREGFSFLLKSQRISPSILRVLKLIFKLKNLRKKVKP